MFDFSTLNYLAIFVTTIVTFGIGAVWYSALFSKPWQKETGLTDKQIADGDPLKTYGGSFVCFFLLNVFLAAIFNELQPSEWMEGAIIGLQTAVLINIATIAITYLYQYKSLKLWLIDSGYHVVLMTVAGAILAVWN
jgi:Protein of unknown function (DUF1761)